MKTGNQEKSLCSGMHVAASLHDDHIIEEQIPENTDVNVQMSSSGRDVSDSCRYGSVAKVVNDAFARGEKFRNYLSPLSPSLSSPHVTSVSHSLSAGDKKFYDPLDGPRKSKVVTNMEIDCFDSDVRAMDTDQQKNVWAMDNDKKLHESSAEDMQECGDQIGDSNVVTCGITSECIPVVVIDSDDDEDKVMHECTDSVTCGNPPDCMSVVIVIDSSDDEDKDLVNYKGASKSAVETCNGEERLRNEKQGSVDAVLSEASILSPNNEDFCSHDRYDEIENCDLDNSVKTPPVQNSIREDTCADNDEVMIHPSCALPVRANEEIETKESMILETFSELMLHLFPSILEAEKIIY